MITVLRRYVGHIIDPPQRLKSSLKTIGGMGCCTKERLRNDQADVAAARARARLWPESLGLSQGRPLVVRACLWFVSWDPVGE